MTFKGPATIEELNDVFYRCVHDSSEAIMITDHKGRLIYVNPRWCKVYGYSPEEAFGQTPSLLQSGYQDKNFYNEMWKQIEDPSIGFWRGELVNKTRNGELAHVLLTITPVRKIQGGIEGYMGIAIDVTEKKLLEARVHQQDRLSSVGLLASGLAHEIGTPLGVVRGRAEFMRMQLENNPVVDSGLNVIIQQIDRISGLIQSLLNLSRKNDDFLPQPVQLQALVNEVGNLMEAHVRKLGIAFLTEVAPDCIIKGDPHRLQQVLLNLFINGVHAIETALEQGRTENHKITIQAKLANKNVIVQFSDTGCGIPHENLGKLFQPFFTTKDSGKGTGLSLAMAEKIITDLKGTVNVESCEGVGTCFTIHLPAHSFPNDKESAY